MANDNIGDALILLTQLNSKLIDAVNSKGTGFTRGRAVGEPEEEFKKPAEEVIIHDFNAPALSKLKEIGISAGPTQGVDTTTPDKAMSGFGSILSAGISIAGVSLIVAGATKAIEALGGTGNLGKMFQNVSDGVKAFLDPAFDQVQKMFAKGTGTFGESDMGGATDADSSLPKQTNLMVIGESIKSFVGNIATADEGLTDQSGENLRDLMINIADGLKGFTVTDASGNMPVITLGMGIAEVIGKLDEKIKPDSALPEFIEALGNSFSSFSDVDLSKLEVSGNLDIDKLKELVNTVVLGDAIGKGLRFIGIDSPGSLFATNAKMIGAGLTDLGIGLSYFTNDKMDQYEAGLEKFNFVLENILQNGVKSSDIEKYFSELVSGFEKASEIPGLVDELNEISPDDITTLNDTLIKVNEAYNNLNQSESEQKVVNENEISELLAGVSSENFNLEDIKLEQTGSIIPNLESLSQMGGNNDLSALTTSLNTLVNQGMDGNNILANILSDNKSAYGSMIGGIGSMSDGLFSLGGSLGGIMGGAGGMMGGAGGLMGGGFNMKETAKDAADQFGKMALEGAANAMTGGLYGIGKAIFS